MKLRNAREFYEAAPAGQYRCKVTATEATSSSKGDPMIAIDAEIVEPKDYAGKTFSDYFLTDEGSKGAGMAKAKLRGMGVHVDSEQEIPDAAIAQWILGREFFVELDTEQMYGETVKGSKVYDKPLTNVDPSTGKVVPALKNVPKAYFTHPTGAHLGPAQSQGYSIAGPPVALGHSIAGPPVPQAVPQPQTPQGVPPWMQQAQGVPAGGPPPWAIQGPSQAAPVATAPGDGVQVAAPAAAEAPAGGRRHK